MDKEKTSKHYVNIGIIGNVNNSRTSLIKLIMQSMNENVKTEKVDVEDNKFFDNADKAIIDINKK